MISLSNILDRLAKALEIDDDEILLVISSQLLKKVITFSNEEILEFVNTKECEMLRSRCIKLLIELDSDDMVNELEKRVRAKITPEQEALVKFEE